MEWKFTEKDPGMSGAPTLLAGDNQTSYIVGRSPHDREFFGVVIFEDENKASDYDGIHGWEDLIGPQNEYSQVDTSSEKLDDILNALEKTFRVVPSEKDIISLLKVASGLSQFFSNSNR